MLVELRNVIASDATLRGLLGSGSRIYPMLLPQNAQLPALVYQTLPSAALAAADGDTRRRESRVQLSYWARDYAGAQAGETALRSRLTGYQDGAIRLVRWDMSRDDYDEGAELYRSIIELEIFWIE